MPDIRIATPEEISELSALSVRQGGIPLISGKCIAAIWKERNEKDEDDILGFAAVQQAWMASGSFVVEKHRRQKHSYELRNVLDNELRRLQIPVYLAIPNKEFEKALFAKYGQVTEHLVQVRHL